MMAVVAGNAEPSAKDVTAILDSVGMKADDDRLNKLISELKGKNIDEVCYVSRSCWRCA